MQCCHFSRSVYRETVFGVSQYDRRKRILRTRSDHPSKNGKLGDTVYPDYVPRIRLLQVQQDRPARIIGKGAKIEIRSGSSK